MGRYKSRNTMIRHSILIKKNSLQYFLFLSKSYNLGFWNQMLLSIGSILIIIIDKYLDVDTFDMLKNDMNVIDGHFLIYLNYFTIILNDL